jgi:ribose/xylose/arabinose/galactoside ABC-type transport system permease subunit
MRVHPRHVPVLVTGALLLLLFMAGGIQFEGFASTRVFFNLFTDNAFLAITAIGMTFVILSGGIDLSVGAVVALSGLLCAVIVERLGWHPLQAIPVILLAAALFGGVMGTLIHHFRMQPFIVTLAGMFLTAGGVGKKNTATQGPEQNKSGVCTPAARKGRIKRNPRSRSRKKSDIAPRGGPREDPQDRGSPGANESGRTRQGN